MSRAYDFFLGFIRHVSVLFSPGYVPSTIDLVYHNLQEVTQLSQLI